MAKTILAFKVPDGQLDVEGLTRERAVVGETYGLTFKVGRDEFHCLMLFLLRSADSIT